MDAITNGVSGPLRLRPASKQPSTPHPPDKAWHDDGFGFGIEDLRSRCTVYSGFKGSAWC